MTKRTRAGLLLVAMVGAIAGLARCRLAGDASPPRDAERVAAPVTAPAPRPAPTRIARPPGNANRTDDDVIDGRVLDAVTGAGVPDAELTFVGDGAIATFRTSSDGTFLLEPPARERYALASITAAGYLTYVAGATRAPRVSLSPGPGVHGVTLLMSPAVDYRGAVIDAHGAGIAGARVRVLAPLHDDVLDDSASPEWTTGPDGRFTFQAAEDAVLQASHGSARGWARIDEAATRSQSVTILLDASPPRDATITGRVRDRHGAPLAGAQIRATPSMPVGEATTGYATSAADGTFAMTNVDHAAYDLLAEAEDHIRATRVNILGGTRDVELTLDEGVMLSGQVVDHRGAPVPVFTLLVRRRAGSARTLVATRSIVDPQGRFAVRVLRGDYDLSASRHGCASGAATQATAGARDVRVVLGSGAILRGRVIASDDRTPIGHATIACETSARLRDLPPDAGSATRPDGTFELTGIPAGPLALAIRADGYHVKIDTSTIASDGAELGPITLELTRVGADEWAGTEAVGIGVMLSPDGDAVRVDKVLPGGSAFDAGLDFGERITAIDGVPVGPLGIDGAFARIRGTPGTRVTLTVQRAGRDVQLVIERRAFRGPSRPWYFGVRTG